MVSIFKLGSCRTNLVDIETITYNIGYSHTTREIIQYLKIYNDTLEVHDIPFIDCFITEMNNKQINRCKNHFHQSDTILIELSSLKLYEYNGFYYNSNYHKLSTTENKDFITMKLQSDNEFLEDMKEIVSLCGNKKVIFIGHLNMNFYDLPTFNSSYRVKIDELLKQCNYSSIILSELFKDYDYKEIIDKDINHLNDKSKTVIARYLLKMI